jgi:hypothetical protein
MRRERQAKSAAGKKDRTPNSRGEALESSEAQERERDQRARTIREELRDARAKTIKGTRD